MEEWTYGLFILIVSAILAFIIWAPIDSQIQTQANHYIQLSQTTNYTQCKNNLQTVESCIKCGDDCTKDKYTDFRYELTGSGMARSDRCICQNETNVMRIW